MIVKMNFGSIMKNWHFIWIPTDVVVKVIRALLSSVSTYLFELGSLTRLEFKSKLRGNNLSKYRSAYFRIAREKHSVFPVYYNPCLNKISYNYKICWSLFYSFCLIKNFPAFRF